MSAAPATPGDHPETWAARLASGGLSASASERVARSFAAAVARLRARTGRAPTFAFFVPGRIEVLGKHTDYAGGWSLLTAMEWGFAFVGRADPDGDGLLMLDAAEGREVRLPFPGPAPEKMRGWALYPATVARRVAEDFPSTAGGVSVAFASDLPQASGMSSSSALVVGTFLSLAAGLELEDGGTAGAAGYGLGLGAPNDFAARERAAAYLAAVESGRPTPVPGDGGRQSGGRSTRAAGVGTDGGSEDHAAILAARPRRVVRYGFLPTRFGGATVLPPGWTFAVASSGVRAEKAGGAKDVYNRLADETRTAARIWREETGGDEPHLGAILTASPDAGRRLEVMLERGGHTRLAARLRQFAAECTELIPGAEGALASRDLDALGAFVARSQELAENVLGNQIPETSHLVSAARELGAPAASAFGAGFGGAVWALVPADDATRFLTAWRAQYLRRFPDRDGGCAFIATDAGPAAFRLL